MACDVVQNAVRFGTLDPRKMEDVTSSVLRDGCFVNPWDTWREPSFGTGLKFMFTRSESRLPSKQELDQILPVLTPDFSAPPNSGIKVTWLGHASLLVQFDGVSILTDPIFSSFCGPASLVGYKRYRPAPCTVQELPKIHAVVISNSHYDNLDLPTVEQLNNRFGRNLRWFVPLGMKDWFTKTGVEDVIELDWWQENNIPSHSEVTFAFTPAQYWSMRNYIDRNKSLWGSWSIIGPYHSFFFAGDTGYCKAFKDIGRRYGPFDLAAIPIGAYKPRALLSPQHVDPPEAVQIHSDIQARQSVGIHWGTFQLGKEGYLAPLEDLKIALDKVRLTDQDFFTLKHGETRLLAEEEDQRGE
ncbi:N-acyl-phosphatidylethanolamine-hydrolyzing phospholipase D-like [Patiria miniata]|uniref:Metallo-beta-lactamase domain-containing protein n=1 Tax=Patiria miniata TaxID=46514 RepID=A0A914AWX0_PATMI|nr:N-acyl-phosphatidylethanolamine-hydrolyzing phospholipase D-like [Patiria miniata]